MAYDKYIFSSVISLIISGHFLVFQYEGTSLKMDSVEDCLYVYCRILK